MKKLIYILVSLAFIAAGCEQSLDIKPFNRFDAEFVFTDGLKSEQYVVRTYNYLPYGGSDDNGYNRLNSGAAMIASASDEAMPNTSTAIEILTNGSWSSSSGNPDARWNENYQAIRAVNLGLENLHLLQGEPELKNRLTAELHFMRAYAHFELLKRYGGVPILDRTLLLDEDLNISRNTFAETIDFIVSELDEAIKYLPSPEEIAGGELGRASTGTALALKSKVLLLAASDLFNGPGYDGTTNELIGYGSYSATRWEAAAEAAADVINLGYYELYQDEALTDAMTDAQAAASGQKNYSDLFLTLTGNKELILIRTSEDGNMVEKKNTPVGFTNGQGTTNPSQQMVDAYGMLNGLGINDPASGYDPLNPYAGRDPRFEASIFYNGKSWGGRNVETFIGGADNQVTSTEATKTGYYLAKFMASGVKISGSETNTHHCFPIIRYAEILLNYAEAMNEAYGPDADPEGYGKTAREAVEEVRGRVLRPMYAAVQASVDTKEEMRDFIRAERRVELAFEDQRHLDVRRWKIAPETIGQNLKGIRITKNGSDLTYELVNNASQRTFDTKMYLYPIPKKEVDNNKALAQNPLW